LPDLKVISGVALDFDATGIGIQERAKANYANNAEGPPSLLQMKLPVCRCVVIALGMCMIHVDKIQAESPEFTSRWIGQLSSSNAAEADQAALKIFQDGNYSLAGLMKLLDEERPFAGQLLYWNRASELQSAPTLGYVAMYLIQAILRQRLFETALPRLARADNSRQTYIDTLAHLKPVPELTIKRSSSLELPADDLRLAKAAYRAWWTKRKSGEDENKNPLDGTGLEWE
jgi:hypothetical protein